MYRVAKAMTCEFVRHWWWWISVFVAAIVGAVALRSYFLSYWGLSIEESVRLPDSRYWLCPIGLAASLLVVVPALHENRVGLSYYTKPVPTWFLVGWKMFLGALTAALRRGTHRRVVG